MDNAAGLLAVQARTVRAGAVQARTVQARTVQARTVRARAVQAREAGCLRQMPWHAFALHQRPSSVAPPPHTAIRRAAIRQIFHRSRFMSPVTAGQLEPLKLLNPLESGTSPEPRKPGENRSTAGTLSVKYDTMRAITGQL
ncbi:hypothetical protein PSTEL_06520 [Paenibacillus stellifer]|uniref:Uncharacterized protein n=1 Tax=Paenibacillus stellifer TaxID=169760 RepID=A0A089LPL4_9BACL|nr:hypothetical protein PSTEL_06520 [Paenibacillus stellifer]